MTNPFTNRFKACHDDLKEKGVLKSSSGFAQDIGTYRQTLNGIFKGGRNLQMDMLRLAVEKYFFNPYYILTGTGEKFINPEKDIEEEDNIKMVPIKAQAGYSDQMLDPVFNQSLPTFSIPVPKFKEGEYYSFEVEGDSMYPTLDDGELLICSKLDPVYYSHTIKNDKVYVFVTQDEVLVKRATNKIYPNGLVTLNSDNSQEYKAFNMKVSKLKEVWKVEGVIKTSLPKPKDDSQTVEKLKEILSTMMEK